MDRAKKTDRDFDNVGVEFVTVTIPGKNYEEKLVQLVEALLAVVENPSDRAEDDGVKEAA